MTNILQIGVGIIILPILLVLLAPLIDQVFTDEVIQFINQGIDGIEYVIGSTGTNTLFICIGIIIVLPPIRRFLSFIMDQQRN